MPRSDYVSSTVMKASSWNILKTSRINALCLSRIQSNQEPSWRLHELLAEFQSDVAKDGRIDLHLEGDMSSFLSVRYLNNTETGEITPDQEVYIDTLLAPYNMTECNPNKVPLKTSVNLDEITARLPRTPHPEVVSLYAKLIGSYVHRFQHSAFHCSARQCSCLLHDYCKHRTIRAC